MSHTFLIGHRSPYALVKYGKRRKSIKYVFLPLFFSVKNPRPAIDIRNRPRIPVPDEDPYSIAGSGSSGSSGNGNRERSRDKPPKLPPRDNSIYATGGLGKVKVRDIC